jgi:hypothetical protein
MKNQLKRVAVLVAAIVLLFSLAAPVAASNNPLENIDLNDMMSNTGFGNHAKTVSSFFSGFAVFFFIILGLIVAIWILVIASLKKSRQLDRAMQDIQNNPCQANAEAAVAAFSHINPLVRFNLSSGGDKRGVHFTMWREIFNNVLIPCNTVRPETKEALRKALVALNTHSLAPVMHTQTAEEAKEAADAFGQGGEDNVWHNLKSLQGCDVYRNVKLTNDHTDSEIDAVIVDEAKGIFLIEIKSAGGVKMPDGSKVIQFQKLKEDPSNQIYRHEFDFKACFENLGIDRAIQNVLVFSWPNGDTRRMVDRSTFPRADYDILTVEELMRYYRTRDTNPLSPHQKAELTAKLETCSAEKIIR